MEGKDVEIEDLKRELNLIQQSAKRAKEDYIILTAELNKITEEEEDLITDNSQDNSDISTTQYQKRSKSAGFKISEATELVDEVKDFVSGLQEKKNSYSK